MHLFDYVLEEPRYGWKDKDNNLIKPSGKQIFREFFYRLNIFRDKKNWLPFFSWLKVLLLIPFFFLFVFLSIKLKFIDPSSSDQIVQIQKIHLATILCSASDWAKMEAAEPPELLQQQQRTVHRARRLRR